MTAKTKQNKTIIKEFGKHPMGNITGLLWLNFTDKKYILKKSLQGRLPANILKQRKEGFNAPISSWLANCESKTISQLKKRSLSSGFFREQEVAALWDDHLQLRRDNGLRLFGLIMFDEWQRQPFLSESKKS